MFHTINRVIHRYLWITGLVTRSEGPMVSHPGRRAFGCADPDHNVSAPLGWTIRLTPDDHWPVSGLEKEAVGAGLYFGMHREREGATR